MTSFRFFEMAAVRDLRYSKVGNFNCKSGLEGQYATLPYFVPIGQTVAEIWPFFYFPRWRPSAILNLFYACLDHPEEYFVVFITVQNLVGIGDVI